MALINLTYCQEPRASGHRPTHELLACRRAAAPPPPWGLIAAAPSFPPANTASGGGKKKGIISACWLKYLQYKALDPPKVKQSAPVHSMGCEDGDEEPLFREACRDGSPFCSFLTLPSHWDRE